MGAVPYQNPSFSTGGPLNAVNSGIVAIPGDPSVFALTAMIGSSTSGRYLKFVKMGQQSTSLGQYQVPAGKKFLAVGILCQTSATFYAGFGYGTAALVAEDTATPPTGEKFFAGAAGNGSLIFTGITAISWLPVPVQFPAESFPFVKCNTSTQSGMWVLVGKEVDE